jgi:(E)-4-hydroxy-3-methylbut-2-enyl-diphosphate synthase
MQYCNSIFKTQKRKTRVVQVGNIGIGGDNPIRVQSMTTSCTRDVDATVDQIIKLADAGCDIVRVTVQGIKEAESCELIKNELIKKGYTTPLVADIHFYPPAAMRVVDFVDKVRINPGNFVDKRASFKVLEYDDASYYEEILKIEEKFTPLVLKCKTLKRAMRIGTNHGSLSDRIMNRFGDTPKGMVESALEFARVCRANDYHDFVFSMKASNPQVMIQAYRLLTAEMNTLGWDYPLHLGVTEAGEGEDGRIKSAMGIGALLLDGLGDTIRISLTEDPWYEIDPCKRLLEFARIYEGKGIDSFNETFRDFVFPKKRQVNFSTTLSLHKEGSVLLSVDKKLVDSPDFYKSIGASSRLNKPKIEASTADLLIIDESLSGHKKIEELKSIGVYSLSKQASKTDVAFVEDENWSFISQTKPELIILSPKNNRLHFCRKFFEWLYTNSIDVPVILNFTYNVSKEDLVIHAAAEMGALLCDGLGEGVWIEGNYDTETLRTLSFNILQAARKRTFKTEFISCPSCGRTLFNIQEVAKKIHSKTAHLPGVKIAVMGCIVNGPGEMADADFGYVGSKPGKIDLYVGKECVERDIDGSIADDRLVDLIKRHGRWKDPEEVEPLSVS